MLDSLDTLVAFVLIMLVVSLLITIAVQMVSSVLNLRGFNLAQGLKRAFAVIVPNSDQEARKLANFVLKGRFLSDSFLPDLWVFRPWRHAAAIRPSEVFDAIQRIAIGKEPVGNESGLRETARKLLIALGVDEKTIDGAAKINAAQQSTKELTEEDLKSLPAVAQTKVRDALKDLTGRLDAARQAVATQIVSAAGAIETGRQKFEKWTCTAQERAQQWVTMHTRILTVIFAVVAAFWLQLDTVEIFKLVSSNKAVRDQLVAQAGAVQAQAARVLGDSNTVLKDALKAWSAKQTDPAIATLLANVEVKDTDTREAVQDKIAKDLGGKTPIDNFDAMVNATATQRLKEQAGNFSTVKADFEKTGFDLFPRDNHFRWGKTWCDGFNEHLAGMLFSVGLLSLGAPFWYNALKNLMSLRSTVAQNISKEQNQALQQGDGSTPKPPPPPVMPLPKPPI